MSTVSNSVNSVNSVNSFNSVNSVNNVNSVNSYSAVLPPSPMVFFQSEIVKVIKLCPILSSSKAFGLLQT